jgi:hypothetical protein
LEKVSKVDLPLYRTAQFEQFTPSDVFIGYHNDAPASIVLRLGKECDSVIDDAKAIFLECATPDAISRLSETSLSLEEKKKVSELFYDLRKNSLFEAIQNYSAKYSLIQVTTFSRLLTEGGKKNICQNLNRNPDDIQMLTLQQINTEEQFSNAILDPIKQSIGLEWWVIKHFAFGELVDYEYFNNKQEDIDRYNDINNLSKHYFATNPVQVDWVSMLRGCNNNIMGEE